MPRIEWSPQSRNDLRAIRQYIAERSPQRAGPYVRKLRLAAKRLEGFPLLGEVVHYFQREDVREVICGNYRIIYHYDGSRLRILAVVHSARLLDVDMLGFE